MEYAFSRADWKIPRSDGAERGDIGIEWYAILSKKAVPQRFQPAQLLHVSGVEIAGLSPGFRFIPEVAGSVENAALCCENLPGGEGSHFQRTGVAAVAAGQAHKLGVLQRPQLFPPLVDFRMPAFVEVGSGLDLGGIPEHGVHRVGIFIEGVHFSAQGLPVRLPTKLSVSKLS